MRAYVAFTGKTLDSAQSVVPIMMQFINQYAGGTVPAIGKSSK